MSNKKDKPKRKISKMRLASTTVWSLIGLAFVCLCVGLVLLFTMLKDKPELNVDEFVAEQSTQIFDKNGELIAEVGSVKRQNVSYDDLPNVLVDAFVSVEDSRYFTHPGFDISRFSKAMLENLKSFSFAQGGSTFTMQLVKNTYFVDDEAGIGASKSIERKVQEIALALELEQEINKKTIFELYLNKLNFGGSGNIRGVQKAAQYYFGKDVQDLNLPESAMLAGVINAPYTFNPHRNLEKATSRRNTVLYLMNYHGYITDEEYELAKAVKVEDLLVDPNKKGTAGEGNPYQAYVDEVIAETIRLTGSDPTVTPMRIYTAMDKDVQSLMDHIQAGEVDGYFTYPDELFELASISINNQTGEINGILGGRNYSYGGELLLNHATSQYNQPGSTIKPMLDYALAFENLGWSTSHVVMDKPIIWAGTDIVVTNSTNTYNGEVTLKDAVGNSLNTPAVLTLQEVVDKKTSAYVVEYMNNLGFTQVTTEDFNVQYGIGGSTFTVSVKQLASAQSTILNGGVRVEPHTIRRIEYLSGKEPFVPLYNGTQVLSEESAFLVSELLYSNVYGPYANLMQILKDDYAVYAKTGTTDWGKSGVQYGIPVGAAKDGWMIGSTSEYTICTWIGYEKAIKDQNTYLSNNKYLANIQGKVTNLLLDQNVETNGKPEKIAKPKNVTSITHILGTYPYVSPIEGMDEKYITTGFINIKSPNAKLVNPEAITIEQYSGKFTASLNPVTGELNIDWAKYPDESKLEVASEELDISLRSSSGSVIKEAKGKRLFDYSWIYGPIQYKANVKRNGESVGTITSKSSNKVEKIDFTYGDKFEVCGFYAYEKHDVKSNETCIEFEIADNEISIAVPSTSATLDEIKTWANNTKINLTYSTLPTSDVSLIGKTIIKDNNGNQVNDKTLNIKQSVIAASNWTAITYVKEDVVVSIDSLSEAKIGDTINLSAIINISSYNNDSFRWVVISDQGSISVPNGKNASFVVPENVTRIDIKLEYVNGSDIAQANKSITITQ